MPVLAPRPSILHLPPHLRVSAYQQHLRIRRNFSASTPQKSSLLDIAVAGPSAILDSLHNVLGLPWYATLPTSALIVRGIFVHYLVNKPNHRSAQLNTNLVTLAQASVSPNTRKLKNKSSVQDVLKASMAPIWEYRALRKRLGIASRYPRSLLGFGVLIAMAEAIRMKAGRREGLLSVILSPFEWIMRKGKETIGIGIKERGTEAGSASASAISNGTAAVSNAASTSAEDTKTMLDPLVGGVQHEVLNTATSDSSLVSSAGLDSTTELISLADESNATWQPLTRLPDPTLQTEGIPGWCIDLTQPDPTYILPMALFAFIVSNTIFRRHNLSPPSPTAAAAMAKAKSAQCLAQYQSLIEPGYSLPSKIRAAQVLKHAELESEKLLSSKSDPEPPPVPLLEKLGIRNMTNLGRIQIMLGAIFSMMATQMPAAILLYVVSNMAIAFVQRLWMDIKLPIPPPITACKRPVKYRAQRPNLDRIH